MGGGVLLEEKDVDKGHTRLGIRGSSVGRASDRHAADAGLISRCGKGFFSQSPLSMQTLFRCPYSPCAVACIDICGHDKDPVVHVRVGWITATQTDPAGTVSDKHNQLDDCGRSNAMRKLLQRKRSINCRHHRNSHRAERDVLYDLETAVLLFGSVDVFVTTVSWKTTNKRLP